MNRCIAYLFVLLFVSCTKTDDFGPQTSSEDLGELEKVYRGILLVNEGNFGFGNSSLSTFDFESSITQNQVFQRRNSKKLGDVAQSAIQVDSILVVVVNNSNKLVLVQKDDLSWIRDVDIIGAPRYAVHYKNFLLVSTMGSNHLMRVSLSTFEVEPWVKVDGWLDEMILRGNLLYACNRTSDRIEVIDVETGVHVKSLNVGQDPESITTGENDSLFVLCSGGYDVNDRSLASIYAIHNQQAHQVFQFSDIEHSPSRIRYHVQSSRCYLLNQGLNAFEHGMIQVKFEQELGNVFYGLGIHPQTGRIFVANAKNYVENGELWELDESAGLLRKSTVGIIPQHVLFYE